MAKSMKVLLFLTLADFALCANDGCDGNFYDVPWCSFTLFTEIHGFDEAKCICERSGLALLDVGRHGDLSSFVTELENSAAITITYPVWYGQKQPGNQCTAINSLKEATTEDCGTNAQFVCVNNVGDPCFEPIGTDTHLITVILKDCCGILQFCMLSSTCTGVLLIPPESGGSAQCYWSASAPDPGGNTYSQYITADFVQVINSDTHTQCLLEQSTENNIPTTGTQLTTDGGEVTVDPTTENGIVSSTGGDGVTVDSTAGDTVSPNSATNSQSDTTGVEIMTTAQQTPQYTTNAQDLTTNTDEISPTSTEGYCECPCDYYEILYQSRVPLTLEEAEEKAAELKSELKAAVEITNTSAYIYSKISAEDPRTSAQSIGYVGIALLSGVFGAILLFDLPVIVQHFRLMWRNICSRS